MADRMPRGGEALCDHRRGMACSGWIGVHRSYPDLTADNPPLLLRALHSATALAMQRRLPEVTGVDAADPFRLLQEIPISGTLPWNQAQWAAIHENDTACIAARDSWQRGLVSV